MIDQPLAELARLLTEAPELAGASLEGRFFGVVELIVASGMTYDFTRPRRKGHLRRPSKAFVEQLLPVLGGMQLPGRFNLLAVSETLELCHGIQDTYPELARERVREEGARWAKKSAVSSVRLRFLEECGRIEHFPEVNVLRGVSQDPMWHPEGVVTHTSHCCDAVARLPEWKAADTESKIAYTFTMLAHDFATPDTSQTVGRDGMVRIVLTDHEALRGPLAGSYLNRIQAPRISIERVFPLVTHRLSHIQPLTECGVRRLSRKLEPESMPRLFLVMTADHVGRPPKPAVAPRSVITRKEMSESLAQHLAASKPFLLGRHLIEQGLRSGTEFSARLSAAFEAQLDGCFHDLSDALAWLRGHLEMGPVGAGTPPLKGYA